MGVLGFDSRRGLGIFLFTASRPALGPTQPPIQCVPGDLSLGVNRPECEADNSPTSSAEVKEWVELYLHSPNTPSWRGAQLKHRENLTFLRFTTMYLRVRSICDLFHSNLRFANKFALCWNCTESVQWLEWALGLHLIDWNIIGELASVIPPCVVTSTKKFLLPRSVVLYDYGVSG
jgi:hypothetical protein